MFRTIGRVHDRLSETGLWLGMGALAAIAAISFAATMSRYLLGAPIAWVPDWSGYLLAFSIFVTAPAVTKHGQHVAMDILASVFTAPRLLRLLSLGALLATFAILVTMSWIVWQSLLSALGSGTMTAAGYPIPRWWLLAVVLYGFASSALHVLRMLACRSELAGLPQPLAATERV